MRISIAIGLLLCIAATVRAAAVDVISNAEKNRLYAESIKGNVTYYFEDENGNLVAVDFDELGQTSTASRSDVADSVIFLLYTVDNTETADVIHPNDSETLANSHWDSSKPTRIITHGWLSSSSAKSCYLIRDAYLKNNDYNVIVVDWSSISSGSYLTAAGQVYAIGGYVAQMVDFLETEGMDLSDLIMAGHSLGAHIVGLAGYQTMNTVGYIVGLDPASPMFWYSGSGERISQGDAAYVQIIHTNAGVLGYADAIGDIDFYPNGGTAQNGCTMDVAGVCSHSRSYEYFAESINSEVQFVGTYCKHWWQWLLALCKNNSVAYMGGCTPTTTTESGTYFLQTNNKSTYARGA